MTRICCAAVIDRAGEKPFFLYLAHHAVHTPIVEGDPQWFRANEHIDDVDGANGLTVPGMPPGSPGMPSPTPEPYDVFAIGESEPVVIGRYKGAEPIAE